MARHNIPSSFSGLTGIFQELFSRVESLERRPSIGRERITISADATLDPVTRYVWVNNSTATNVTLPDMWDGAIITFKNQTSNTVTVFPTTSTIDGGASATVGGLNAVKTFQSDGSVWISM